MPALVSVMAPTGPRTDCAGKTISLARAIRYLLQVRRQFGWLAALIWMVDRLVCRPLNLDLNRLFLLKMEQLGEATASPPHLECRFLYAQEVRAFAQNPANDLEATMADRIDRGNNLCFGILYQGKLVAYGWYAFDSIEAEHNRDVAMSFPADVVYMYKAFTLPAFRGQSLDGLGRRLAFRALAERGIRKLLATVHWTNWPPCEVSGARVARTWAFCSRSVRAAGRCLVFRGKSRYGKSSLAGTRRNPPCWERPLDRVRRIEARTADVSSCEICWLD
jgi:hypothetical protein